MDFGDEPALPQSMVPTILYGAVLGALLCATFFLSYLAAPNLPIAGTAVIAVVVVSAVIGAIAYRTRGQLNPEPLADAGADVPSPSPQPRPLEVLAEEMEAQIARLREEAGRLDRGPQHEEWADKMLAIGDLHQKLAQQQMTRLRSRGGKAAMSNFRMGANMFRRVAESRTTRKFPHQWVRARNGLGECMLMLGQAEGNRAHLEESAASFAMVLETSELEGDERQRATKGLQQAETALTESTATNDRREDLGGEFF